MLAESPHFCALVDVDAQTNDTRPLRWVRIDSHTVICRADHNAQTVELLSLFHATSSWRRRVLGKTMINCFLSKARASRLRPCRTRAGR